MSDHLVVNILWINCKWLNILTKTKSLQVQRKNQARKTSKDVIFNRKNNYYTSCTLGALLCFGSVFWFFSLLFFYGNQCCVVFWILGWVLCTAKNLQWFCQPECWLLQVVEGAKLAGSRLFCDFLLNAAFKSVSFCDFSASG